MCSGAILLYSIPKIVVGENLSFQGPEDYIRSRGVELLVKNNQECRHLMQRFIKFSPQLWNEDIGI